MAKEKKWIGRIWKGFLFGITVVGVFQTAKDHLHKEKIMQLISQYWGLCLIVASLFAYLISELINEIRRLRKEIRISRKQRKGSNQLVAEVLIPYILYYGDETFKKDLLQFLIERNIKLNESALELLPPDMKKMYTDMEQVRDGATVFLKAIEPQLKKAFSWLKKIKDESDATYD